jgi:hypothetical protein
MGLWINRVALIAEFVLDVLGEVAELRGSSKVRCVDSAL